jgi:hypothetical protein
MDGLQLLYLIVMITKGHDNSNDTLKLCCVKFLIYVVMSFEFYVRGFLE